MAADSWTVVFRRSKRAPVFTRTGFEGSWQAAADHAREVIDRLPPTAEVWYVPVDATTVKVDSGRDVKIGPPKARKESA